MKNDKKKDKDWDGYEPMTGTPMTGNMDSSFNYSTNGTTKLTEENNVGYVPDMRADADRHNKNSRDIKEDVEQSFNADPNLKNNIATQEFDYTKEESRNGI